MPPKRKIKKQEQELEPECTKCSRHKHRTQVVCPQIRCEEGERPDLFIIGTAPSESDDRDNKHFTNKSGLVYLRPMLKEITDSYVIDTAVRCFSNGQPTKSAIDACRPNWMELIKKYDPKVVVALGKYGAEAVLGKKIKLAKVVGQSLGVEYNGHTIPTVFNYAPGYVAGFDGKKGGEAEKTKNLWFDTWDIVDDVLNNGLSEKPKVRILKNYSHVLKFLDFLLNDYDGVVAYDYETNGDVDTLRPELCNEFKILTIGVGYNGKGVSFPMDYPGMFSDSQVKTIRSMWIKILKQKDCVKVAQNAKYEHKCNISRLGFTHYLEDTMLIMNVIHELAPCSLGSIGGYFGFSWAGYKIEMSGIQQNPIDTPIDELLEYNALDALLTYLIYYKGMDKLSDKAKVILGMKQRYALHLAKVEMDGLYVNDDEIPIVRAELVKARSEAESVLLKEPAIKKVEAWCRAYKKEEGQYVLDKRDKKVQNIKSFKEDSVFNPKSPVQMQRLCLKELKLPVDPVIKWKDGKKVISWSFDKKTLEPLEDLFPICKHLNALRSLNSMFSGFLDKWENFTGPDGCCHTNYNQDVVLTGRLSSTSPNLQNVPTASIIKRVFSSRYGDEGLILSADYKQLEPRILAGWSGDPAMCEALNGGFDLHTYVSSKIFDVEYKDVTFEQRQLGKRMNLGQMYGQTPEGLAKAANISLEHAKELQRVYYQRFPGIKEFRLKYHVIARRCGESLDLFGGVRHLPDAMSQTRRLKERAERQASNYPIQSTGNHFCLIGLCDTMDIFEEQELPALMVGTVHDSIIVDFKKEYLDEVVDAVNKGMLVHNDSDYWGDKPVPMAIDISIGPNYKDLVDLKEAA